MISIQQFLSSAELVLIFAYRMGLFFGSLQAGLRRRTRKAFDWAFCSAYNYYCTFSGRAFCQRKCSKKEETRLTEVLISSKYFADSNFVLKLAKDFIYRGISTRSYICQENLTIESLTFYSRGISDAASVSCLYVLMESFYSSACFPCVEYAMSFQFHFFQCFTNQFHESFHLPHIYLLCAKEIILNPVPWGKNRSF